MNDARVLCLCCGALYEFESDCPFVDEWHHSLERALEVTLWLRANEIEQPTSREILVANALVDLHASSGGA